MKQSLESRAFLSTALSFGGVKKIIVVHREREKKHKNASKSAGSVAPGLRERRVDVTKRG